jgi:uncharacterized SAM-dependent methyltransferase
MEARAHQILDEAWALGIRYFDADESIWTESSYKYDREALDTLVTSAGFRITRLWTDIAERFWVAYLDAT